MYLDFPVRIPEVKGKIYEKTIKGVTYINYEYDRIYKPDKKYNIPKRTTIGRKSSDDPAMMYPNPNFLKYFPDAELPEAEERNSRSACLCAGTYLVIQKLIEESGVDRIVEDIYNDKRGSGLFLDLASCYLVTGNNAGQYYSDYAYNHPLFTPDNRIYSDSTVSRFLSDISAEDSAAFQNEWNASKEKTERIYISCDSADRNCQAGLGRAKDDEGFPVISCSVAYDCNKREPLFYEDCPGGIVDVSQIQCMLDRAKAYGYEKAGFILDRGYFSRESIRYMDRCGCDFVIMVKGACPFVREQIGKVRGSFESEWASGIGGYRVNGTTVKTPVFCSDEKDRYLHIYYSYAKAASEKALLENSLRKTASYLKMMEGQPVVIDREYEKYFSLEYCQADQRFICAVPKNDVISRELRMCGYFCIITSSEMTAKEALELYKSRDASEKLFREDKSFLGNCSFGEALEGKMLIAFTALIIRNRFYTGLRDQLEKMDETPDYMNVPDAVRELEKIEMIRQADGVYRRDRALTAAQKTILKSFGIDANYVNRKIRDLSACLSSGNKNGKI